MSPEQAQGILICVAILITTLAISPMIVWGIGWPRAN